MAISFRRQFELSGVSIPVNAAIFARYHTKGRDTSLAPFSKLMIVKLMTIETVIALWIGADRRRLIRPKYVGEYPNSVG
jgi:hypothetical protein